MNSLKKDKLPLSRTHPHLMDEWDFDKNEIRPEEVTNGSNRKVWWLCRKENCGHSWGATVYNRTGNKRGCPACAGKVATKNNSLATKFPELCEEWDYDRNLFTTKEVTPGSEKKAWWVCKKCEYKWETSVNNRAGKNPTGCPRCAGMVISEKNNFAVLFPHLLEDWDYKKNKGVDPYKISSGTHKRIYWSCHVCSHPWSTYLFNRTLHKSGCPGCSKKAASSTSNVKKVFPELLKEWDYVKNKVPPDKVSSYSAKKVWWKCRKCNHNWEAVVFSRTAGGNGCPACANQVVTDNNRLSILFPEIVKDWDYTKNKICPEEVTSKSGRYIWWVCNVCGYGWRTKVCKRTVSNQGCSNCAKGSSVSKISQRWLDSLNIPNLEREYYIKDLKITVDGFDPETNTVYEFLGDYWHGNPKVYSAEEKNLVNKKTFGRLFQKTLKRISKLEEAGYKVVYMWESSYNKEGIE